MPSLLPSFRRLLIASLGLTGLLIGRLVQAQTIPLQVLATMPVAQAPFGLHVLASAADAAGNVYLAGYHGGQASFGTATLTCHDVADGFVAKWNAATGTIEWVRSIASSEGDYARAIAVRGDAVYVSGFFTGGTASLGNLRIANSSRGNSNGFVAKLSTDTGNFLWAQPLRADGSEADGLAVNGTSIYICGSFLGSLQFGGISHPNFAALGSDAYVARLTDQGTSVREDWVWQAGGNSTDVAAALCVQGNHLYVAGSYRGATAAFGPVTLANSSTSTGIPDVFVAKLTDTGTGCSTDWARRAGGPGADELQVLAMSGTAIYVGGTFQGATATFGGSTLANTPITSGTGYSQDGFVARISSTDGSFAWAQRLGGPEWDDVQALTASSGTVLVAGKFASPTLTLGGTTLTHQGTYDGYLARLRDDDSSARFTNAQRVGGSGFDEITSLLLRGGTVYVGGSVSLPAAIGSQTLSGAANSQAGFLATFTAEEALAAAPAAALPELNLYPNPAHTTVRVQVPAASGPAALLLCNALGQQVRTYLAELSADRSVELNLAGLASGLYTLHLQTTAGPVVRRLAVE